MKRRPSWSLRVQNPVWKWRQQKHGNSMKYRQRHYDDGKLTCVLKVLGKGNEVNILEDFSIQWLG